MEALVFFLSVFLRILPHPANFAPMGAASIFSGAKLNKRYIFLIVLLSAFITDYALLYINPFSDQVLNLSKLHSPFATMHATTFFVYLSFMISAGLGLMLRGKKFGWLKLGTLSLASATLFFLITNFGVWATGSYARDLSGLMMSYEMGLPFFRATLASELFYSFSIFGLYQLAAKLKSSDLARKQLKLSAEKT